VQQPRLAGRLQLAPQVQDVHLDHVGVGGEVVAPHPGQQLLQGERPAQAVVGPRLQALDPLADPGRGGEQDDRGVVAGGAQPPADLQPGQPGRAGVEQDAVHRGAPQHVEGALAVARDDDPEPLALEDRPDAVVIVDDQERTRHARLADAGRRGRPSPGRPGSVLDTAPSWDEPVCPIRSG
jgi:hypothetical protein